MLTFNAGHRPNNYASVWPHGSPSEEHLLPTIPTDRPIPSSLLARLNAVMAAGSSIPHSASIHSNMSPPSSIGITSRNIAEILPIIENSQSPPPSDVASNTSNHSNGAGFFRTYQDGIVHSRTNEVRTPDLNFAEIGHGRGAIGGGIFSNSTPQVNATPATFQMRQVDATPATFQMRHSQPVHTPHARLPPGMDLQYGSSSSDSQSQSPPIFSNPGQPESGWSVFEPGLLEYDIEDDEEELDNDGDKRMSSSSRELHESVRAAFGGSSSSGPNAGVDVKGRGVRNGLRSTINAAEHNISSFLFGRSSPRRGSEEEHTSLSTRNVLARGGH